ncbi:MAG: alpha/beta fold hydrolase, partial [Geminicoccaceae bacterium]
PLRKQADPALPRYFLIPGTGGHLIPFRPLARRLATRYGLAILHPCLAGQGRPFDSVEQVADSMLPALRRVATSGPDRRPYLLVGYSFGGLPAFEVARRLYGEGEAAGAVLVDIDLTSTRQRSLWRTARYLPLRAMRALSFRLGLRTTTNPFAQRASSGPAHRRYRPEPSRTPLVLIRAEIPSLRQRALVPEADYGWHHVGQVLAVLTTPGEHTALFRAEHADALAARVEQALSLLETHLQARISAGDPAG